MKFFWFENFNFLSNFFGSRISIFFSQDKNSKDEVAIPDGFQDFFGFKKEMISDAVGLFLVILVAVGLRTRLCSSILIIWMTVLNFIVNDFWSHKNTSDWVKLEKLK